jgi:hypothetical protein
MVCLRQNPFIFTSWTRGHFVLNECTYSVVPYELPGTLKSLIEEHARLNFSDFLSTLLAIFHVINEKFHPTCSLIYLVNK